MKRSKSNVNKGSIQSGQKSIKSFFKPSDRSSTSFSDFNNLNLSFKIEDDDSDIEIIEVINKTSEEIQNKDVKIKSEKKSKNNQVKKKKIDSNQNLELFDYSLSENSNLSTQSDLFDKSTSTNLDQFTKQFTTQTATRTGNQTTNQFKTTTQFKTATTNQFETATTIKFETQPSTLFETPTKKKVNYPFNLTCPSPYFKNFSEVIDENYKDLNEFLSLHLDDISKVKTPTKNSDKKPLKFKNIDASSVRKELSFTDSPTKSNQKSPTKLNLLNANELTYSDINRNNFMTILKNVLDDQMNKCLFNKEDWDIISVYTSLSNDAQSLFLRLFFRKNTWIKRSSIKYNEFIDNLEDLLTELLNSRFLIDTRELISLEEGLYLLEPSEVKEFAKNSKVTISNNGKQKMIDNIINFVRTTNTLTFSVSKISLEERKLIELKKLLDNKCFKVNMDIAKVLFRIVLLYFPPIYFDKNLNLLLNEIFFNLYNNSINLSTFPNLKLNKCIQVYTKREDLILYADACILESMISENSSMNSTDLDFYLTTAIEMYEKYVKSNLEIDTTLPYFLRKLTAGQKLLRCISQCVTFLEKSKRYVDANNHLELLLKQNIYCLTDRGKWYDRLITNCEFHLKDEKKAYEYCLQAFEDYYVREALELIIHKKSIRLAKKLKIESFRPLPVLNIPEIEIFANTVKRKVDLRNNVFYEPNDQGGFTVLRVEIVALNHYKDELNFTNGLHSENELFNILFFLLFYDIIFIQNDQIRDIYRFDFQKLPLDFGSDSFYANRKDNFQKRFNYLNDFTNENLFELIEQNYERYKNQKTIINLDSIELNHLKEIILCININSLLMICRRLAEDHRFTRSGFPDLIVWNLDEKKIKAVEVKGPSDSLSEKQCLWINFLNSCGLDSEVCYVRAKK